jgi:hypothetical protein
MNAVKETQTTEIGADLARFLNLPLYFFDLDAALEYANPALARSREQLRAIYEQQLSMLGGNAVTIQAATGFYLIVQAANGPAADEIAQKLNTALVEAFFRREESVPPQFATLFRPVRAGQLSQARATSAPRDGANDAIEDGAPEQTRGSSTSSRDDYSELALRGQLPNQNVELLFHPVHDLLRGRSTTFFCTPAFCVGGEPVISGYKAFEGISQRDLPLIDRAMLAHTLKFARRLSQAGVFTATGAYVSFETLVWSRGRELYQEALRAAGVPDCHSIVICIKDLPVGITASRIAELVAYLRPLAKRVFVHLPNAETPVLNCGYLGANGFVLSQPAKQGPAQIERMAGWLAKVAEAQTALTTIDQIDSEGALEAVRRTSVRFGMGPVFGPTLFRNSSEPIEVESFMKAAARAAQSEGRNVHRFGRRDLRAGTERAS